MATQTAVASQHGTLTPSTLETVTITGPGARVLIKNRSTTVGTVFYATINGATPVVGADDTIVVPAGETRVSAAMFGSNVSDPVIKIIGATADDYTVELTDDERPYSGGGGGVAGGTSANPVYVTSVSSAGTGAKSSVAASVTSVTILAANASRKRWSVVNDSTTGTLKLDSTGGTASATSFSVSLLPGDYFEGPLPVNTGLITGIWDVASGSARVTEFA